MINYKKMTNTKTIDFKDQMMIISQNLYINFEKNINAVINQYPNLAKWILYKINASIVGFDCDATKEVLETLVKYQDSYKDAKISKKSTYKFKIKHKEKSYSADTMNSFWTIFKQFMIVCLQDELNLNKNKIPKKYWKCAKNTNIWLYHFCDNFNNIQSEEKHRMLKKLDEFAMLTHTIGNMIIIPNNYQKIKANQFSDYFDLSLKDIHEYCLNKTFSKLINKSNDYWMSNYECDNDLFKNFIDKNHLTMYVDDKYNPTFLCENKDRMNKEDIEMFLDNVIKNINLRNEIFGIPKNFV